MVSTGTESPRLSPCQWLEARNDFWLYTLWVEITTRHIIIALGIDCKLLACWVLLSVKWSTDHSRYLCLTFFFNSQIQWNSSPCRWIHSCDFVSLESILNFYVLLLISFLISTEYSRIDFIFQNQLLESMVSISLVLSWSFVHLFSERLNVWDKKFPLPVIQSFSTPLLSLHPVLDGGWSMRTQGTPTQTWSPARPSPADLPEWASCSEARASLAWLKSVSPLLLCPEHKLKNSVC